MVYEKIVTLIGIIESKLDLLETWLPDSVEDYTRDMKGQAAIERTIQVIIQAAIDISIQLIKFFNIEPPASELAVIDSLQGKLKSIEILREMKKFRNFLVHIYGRVNDNIVFENAYQLKEDIPRFLDEIRHIITSN